MAGSNAGNDLNLSPAMKPHVVPHYSANSKGLTYGKGTLAVTPTEMPDLIFARTADGTDGYVYAKDIDSPTFSSPEEAAKWSAGDHRRMINVYKSDGTTIIGQLQIGSPPQ